MSAPAPSEAPAKRFWFLASPAHFVFGLLLFLFPWVEVKCNKSETSIGEPGEILLYQSGLQAIYGSSSYPSDIKPAEIIKDVSNLRFPNLPKNTNAPDFRKPTDGAPLMAVYAGVLLVGILAGILLRKTSRRPLIVGICCLTAFFLLLVQTTRGFPIESSLKYEIQLAEEEWLGTLSRGERIHEAMFVRMPVPFLMSYSWFLDISLLLPWMALGAVLWEWKVYWKLREEESP